MGRRRIRDQRAVPRQGNPKPGVRRPAPKSVRGQEGRQSRTWPPMLLVAGGSLITGSVAHKQVLALIQGPYTRQVSLLLWTLSLIAFWNGVRTLLILDIADAVLARTVGAAERSAGRLLSEALTFTGTASLWCTFVALSAIALPEVTSTPVPDLLGRSVTTGIVVGLLALGPIWMRRYWRAYGTVRRAAGLRPWVVMHSAAAVVDLVFVSALFIAITT